MNLYRIDVEHYSQKDSHKSIETFVLAEDDEAVYNWIDKEKQWGIWSDRSNEDGLIDVYNNAYEVIGKETYKEKIIRLKGEINDEDADLDDLFYGRTLYGWEKVTNEMFSTRVTALKGLDILVEL